KKYHAEKIKNLIEDKDKESVFAPKKRGKKKNTDAEDVFKDKRREDRSGNSKSIGRLNSPRLQNEEEMDYPEDLSKKNA
ncbi:MAG: hypothetical protein ACK55I_08495, partial [bacterium]